LRYENVPVLGASVEDIDEAHLWSFVRAFSGDAFDNARAADYPTAEVLERDLLLGTNNGAEVVPTTAGLLLFGRDERVAELIPRAAVLATRFAGDSTQTPIVERVTFTGNLATLYEAMLRFVNRYCDLWDARPRRFPEVENDESPVSARANYHRGAVREAIANALVHRDLALREQPTRLHLFEHSLELVNPRRSSGFSSVALRAIRYGMTERLNPQLSAVFASPAYGQNLETGGLPLLLRDSRLFSGKKTEIYAFNDEFRIRIHGT
jgi:predicted HTH transcriptional regulator